MLRMKVNTVRDLVGLFHVIDSAVLELRGGAGTRDNKDITETAVCNRQEKLCSDSDNSDVKKTRPSGSFNGICDEISPM